MPAASCARTVVLLLSGVRKSVLQLPSAKQPSIDHQPPPQQQPQPAHDTRKRRRSGARRRSSARSIDPRTPSPPPAAEDATPPQHEHSEQQQPPSVLSPAVASPRPSSPPASPVFAICDDAASEPQSPVYDYNAALTEQEQEQQQQHEEARSRDASHVPSQGQSSCDVEVVTLAEFDHTDSPQQSYPQTQQGQQAALTGLNGRSAAASTTSDATGAASPAAAAAVCGAVGCDEDVLLLEDGVADDLSVTDDVVTLLIDGRHERIDRGSQSQSLVAFQPASHSNVSTSTSALAPATAPSAPSRRRARQQQLTFDSGLSLTASRSSALPGASTAARVEAAVEGRVPDLFQPRSREIQQRMTRIATAGSAKKKPSAPTSTSRAATTDSSATSSRSAGKKKAVQAAASSSRPSTASHSASTIVVDGQPEDSNQSRFGNCPLCGEVSTSSTLSVIRKRSDRPN